MYQFWYNTTVSNSGSIQRVIFFQALSGEEPVREWLGSLPVAVRKEVAIDIKMVQKGWPLGRPLVRRVEAELWEIQSNLKSRIANVRVLFTVESPVLVLLHGFILTTARTPRRDVNLARKRLKEWRGAR